MDKIIGIILFALAIFSLLGMGENSAEGNRNAAMSTLGRGSFITRLKTWFMSIVWAILFCIGFFGGLNYWFSGNDTTSNKVAIEKSIEEK
jgi:hypothetical protein